MPALPSRPSQVAPPSQLRSSHTESPVVPRSMLAQAMPSGAETCSWILRPLMFLSGRGNVSCCALDGSRVSQDVAHTVVEAATAGTGGSARTIRRSGRSLITLRRMTPLSRLGHPSASILAGTGQPAHDQGTDPLAERQEGALPPLGVEEGPLPS